MNRSVSSDDKASELTQFEHVVAACDRFEALVQSGGAPQIELFLAEAPASIQSVLFRELLAFELDVRFRRGERPAIDEYVARFPSQAGVVAAAFAERSVVTRDGTDAGATQQAQNDVGRGVGQGLPQIPGYEIQSELGRGAMGVVYLARRVRLNRPCAIKMILAGRHAGSEAAVRFLAEAETIARLKHDGIVQIYGVGDHDGCHYIELEYLEGGSLAQAMLGTPRPARQAAELVQAMADAVGEAHRQGIVHRDLKPANVLLTTAGRPKVADFGLAKNLGAGDGLTRTDLVLGSPSYMAPEQAAGHSRDAGAAADIYALGAIFYELLTGRPPFKGATVLQTLELVKNTEPIPPSRFQPGLPRDAETICLTCLQKDPFLRYASAEALAEDLRRFRAREPIRARRVGTIGVTWRWCRRRPAVASLVAALILSISVVAGVVVAYFHDISRERAIAVASADLARTERNHARVEAVEVARLALERGVQSCEQGEIGRGILWMARSLDLAPDDPLLRRVIRTKIAHWRLALAPLRWMVGYDHTVNFAHFSPDGTRIATGVGIYYSSLAHTARIVDASNGAHVSPELPHGGPVFNATFSLDGRTLHSVAADGRTRVWDASTGGLVRIEPWEGGGPYRHDRRGLAIVRDSRVSLYNAMTGAPFGQPIIHKNGVMDIQWSLDDRLVATASKDGTVGIWDATTGANLRTIVVPNGGYVYSAVFSPDGRRLLITSSYRCYHVYDIETGALSRSTPLHRGGVSAVAYHPDGRLGVTGGADGDAHIIDVATGRKVGQPLIHGSNIRSVEFSPDGREIATASEDRAARLWALPVGYSPMTRIYAGQNVKAAAFSPDGRTIVAGVQKQARRYPADGSPSESASDTLSMVDRVRWRPDGRAFLTVSDTTARLWDASTGSPMPGSVPMHRDRNGPHPGILCSAISPDGRLLLTGCSDSTVRRWDAATGRCLGVLLRTSDMVNALAIRPDGREIVTGDWSGHIRRWDAATGQPLAKPVLHGVQVTDLAYHPDGSIFLSGGADGLARLWNAHDDRPAGPTLEHNDYITRVAFSADRGVMATASRDGLVKLWDVATGTALGPPIRHTGPVLDLDFRPDGGALLTVSAGAIIVWALPSVPADEPSRIASWAQVVSGLGMDDSGVIRPLDASGWSRHRDALQAEGGSPFADVAPSSEFSGHFNQVFEAAEAGDAFAHRWHLDRSGNLTDADRGAAHFALGVCLLNGGHAADARLPLREAARLRPGDSQAHYSLGLATSLVSDHDGAIAAFREAIRLQPDFGIAHGRLGHLLERRAPGLFSLRLTDVVVAARPWLTLAAPLFDTVSRSSLVPRAELAAVRAVTSVFPGSALAATQYGILLDQTGRNAEAITAIESALTIDPGSAEAHSALGAALQNRDRAAGNTAAVVRELREEVRRRPGDLAPLVNLGEILLTTGDFDGAYTTFACAARLRSADGFVHREFGMALRLRHGFAAAVVEFSKSISLAPDDPMTRNERAWILATCEDRRIRNGRLAVEDARRASELTGWDDAEIIDTLAAALAETGNFPEAVKYQAKVVSLNQRGEFKDRLSLYERKLPYHDAAPTVRR
jgi:eukaryotic-like serine/threonine-protein kinase